MIVLKSHEEIELMAKAASVTAAMLEEIEPDLWLLNDDLIKSDRNIELYLYVKGPGWGKTVRIWDIYVSDRPNRGD